MAWLLTILICACTAIAPTASVHTAPTTQQPAITFPEIALPALPTLPDGVASLRNALQRLDVDSVLKTANEGGLVGLFRSAAGKRHEPVAEVAWDTAGSKIDTRCSAYGFSEKLRIRTGPCTKQIEVDNLELTSRVLGTLALDGWNSLSSKDGIDVYKRSGKDIEVGHYPPGVGAKKGDSSRFLCLWARGEIDAPIEKVYNLFLSNDYVLQYNPMCEECRDVGWLDAATKITWATSKRVGPIAPRDFVTRCHYRKLRDDSLVRCSTPVMHRVCSNQCECGALLVVDRCDY